MGGSACPQVQHSECYEACGLYLRSVVSGDPGVSPVLQVLSRTGLSTLHRLSGSGQVMAEGHS